MKSGPYRGGRVHVLSERCSTCVFHPGNLMHLSEGRLKEIVGANRTNDAALTCHQTLSYASWDEVGKEAVCRGYFDAYGHESTPLQLAKRMNLIVEDAPPIKENK